MNSLWTNEEKEYLRENYGKIDNKTLSQTLNRTTKGIVCKAVKMGITTPVNWSQEEENLLKENYQKISAEELAITLNRSTAAIRIKAKSLGLSNTVTYWTKEEEQILSEKWGRVSIKSIAKTFNRSPISVLKKAETMGLREQITADGEFLTPSLIGQIVGKNTRTVNQWILEGYLISKKFRLLKGYKYQVKPRDFILFLKTNPDLWDASKTDLGLVTAFLPINNSGKVRYPKWLTEKLELDRKQLRKGKTRKMWTVKEEETVLKLRDMGLTVSKIAKRLGRTESSVETRLGLLRKNKID